ncbi:hypothetical protein F4779DRAFT_14912 [Xylariaceae sp. FL0662B]|nr:hypothetical protein F4779DRAFT_14912 [Xylariaceae sp. FL0662B]
MRIFPCFALLCCAVLRPNSSFDAVVCDGGGIFQISKPAFAVPALPFPPTSMPPPFVLNARGLQARWFVMCVMRRGRVEV